ncbi:DNA-binding protein [Longimycelium tulufanense]|uniref:DNA-binding protein n=1 Tax=Longimycelium tulufanense TaxID=907463 RepID=A0A8J3CHW8_9PSEU|nr:helix-turn-helix domain-containing protein [Longimycelium tulufanense]GGM69336.1 DNA-binding protein [Longimycelium tulufanense]
MTAVLTGEHYSVEEAAAYLNTSVRFVRRLISERRITFYKLGRHVRLKREDLEAFVQAGKVEAVTVRWQAGRVVG